METMYNVKAQLPSGMENWVPAFSHDECGANHQQVQPFYPAQPICYDQQGLNYLQEPNQWHEPNQWQTNLHYTNAPPAANVQNTPHIINPSDITVSLCQAELWKQFHREGTEMILTKDGRRIFPGFRIKVEGMNTLQQYCIYLDAISMDGHRYKFQDGEWMIAGKGEPQPPSRMSFHPDSPSLGSKWMKNTISFHKLKLSNSVSCRAKNALILNSMHRYQLRVHVVECSDTSKAHLIPSHCTIFNETSFVTVTAYQNHEVTKLKIANNPYAKGFRKDGARGSKNSASDDLYEEVYPARKSSCPQQYQETNVYSNAIQNHNVQQFDNDLYHDQHSYMSPTQYGYPEYDQQIVKLDNTGNKPLHAQQSYSNTVYEDNKYVPENEMLKNIWDNLDYSFGSGDNIQYNENYAPTPQIQPIGPPLNDELCQVPENLQLGTNLTDFAQENNVISCQLQSEQDVLSNPQFLKPVYDEGYSSPTCGSSPEESTWVRITEIKPVNEERINVNEEECHG